MTRDAKEENFEYFIGLATVRHVLGAWLEAG